MPELLSYRPSIRTEAPSGASRIAVSALRDRRGAAAVELALLLPVLVTFLIGMADYGILTFQTMEVLAAAHAGADYARVNGYNSAAIQTAITSATSLTVTASPAPVEKYGCLIGNTLTFSATTSCASGTLSGTYVIVGAQASFSPILAWSGFGFPSTISSQAVVRVQ